MAYTQDDWFVLASPFLRPARPVPQAGLRWSFAVYWPASTYPGVTFYTVHFPPCLFVVRRCCQLAGRAYLRYAVPSHYEFPCVVVVFHEVVGLAPLSFGVCGAPKL